MSSTRRVAVLAAVLAVLASVVVAANVGAAPRATQSPITIGWAFDTKGDMAPFDGPALAAAQIRVKQINAKGGVNGRPLKIVTCDTQGNSAPRAKSCARQLLGKNPQVIFTTCDVELAAPVVQESINRGLLTIAPCIGTDQMGPKRFGSKGKLAFSFGNAAQDEGSAMAQYAWQRGWKTAGIGTNTALIYFKNVVEAFEKRYTQLGGKVLAKESYASFGANNVGAAVNRLNSKKVDVYVTSTAFAELPAFATGFRTLGNETPILNSWAGDGLYWLPKSPKVTNYYFVTFASAFGDDPNAAVNKYAKQIKAFSGGFVGGVSAIDGVVTAIKRAGGSTTGSALAAQLEKFKNLPTISGKISFSTALHTVFGRQYRVIKIQDNKAHLVGLVRAKVVPKL
ncbi:MAG: ABC transporter substrate-binding protein [Gaiellaceae bacterium]